MTLARIIWVSPHPPISPFTGASVKTRFALDALSRATSISLITFASPEKIEYVKASLQTTWSAHNIEITVLELLPKPSPANALIRRQFQLTQRILHSQLYEALDEMRWQSADTMLVLDEITLAPMADRYGSRSLFTPHDCISAMSKSHLRFAKAGVPLAKESVQYFLARHYEQRYYHKMLLIHLVTQYERYSLQQVNPKAICHVVPFMDEEANFAELIYTHDILVWADLTRSPIVYGAREFLRSLAKESSSRLKILVAGRLSKDDACTVLGKDILNGVEYSQWLEDDNGRQRGGKITVIPDVAGSGLKTRLTAMLRTGNCAACLYQQMEAIEHLCDLGVINANNHNQLAKMVLKALNDNSWSMTGKRGKQMIDVYMNYMQTGDQWIEMVERAELLMRNYVL